MNVDEPRSWTDADVHQFASAAEPAEVVRVLEVLTENPDDVSLNLLGAFLGSRHDHTLLKPVPSQLAAQALTSVGTRGVDFLVSWLLDESKNVRYAPNVVELLWHLSRGRGIQTTSERVPSGLWKREVPPGTQESAVRALQDLFAEARVNSTAFGHVANLLHLMSLKSGFGLQETDAPALMELFAEGAVKLTRSLLTEFARLIDARLPEEKYQSFLTAHPVLLDPLASQVVPKQKLGLEYATDFALKNHDGRWMLVEIERPQDELFNQAGDFRERFTHAFGQVLDFQNWVDHNVSYAQTHMRGIAAPRGLLVMGLRSSLTEKQVRKLQHFAENSRRIEICTFDDLLARATSLYASIRAS